MFSVVNLPPPINPIDCSGCTCAHFEIDGWGTLEQDGNSYTGQSQLDGSIHRLNFVAVGVIGLEIANWSSNEQFGTYFNQFTDEEMVNTWLPVHETPELPFDQSHLTGRCCHELALASHAAFEVSFTTIACS